MYHLSNSKASISLNLMSQARGRFAPTPSGHIHIGNARTALVTWLSVRSKEGKLIWRLEDLDQPRNLEGAAEQAIEDLKWLGLNWDEGGGKGGPFSPYTQSERFEYYENALKKLAELDRLFPCSYSRRELENIARAPHSGQEFRKAYSPSLRPQGLDQKWYTDYASKSDFAFRFKVEPGVVRFDDGLFGSREENVAETLGDFVLKRKDSIYAYQLAVVVDDIAMDITEVVRGSDLLDSTARQIQLIEALGAEVPSYLHVPMILNSDGEKLSKRNKAIEIRELRKEGVLPEQVLGYFAHSLGLIDRRERLKPEDLLASFSPSEISSSDHAVEDELIEVLKKIN